VTIGYAMLMTHEFSIIAVTGLAGHAFGSWKSREGQQMWLRDFLPNALKTARIWTYGYDTKLPGSQSSASILELAKKLLESVKTIRNQQNVSHWHRLLRLTMRHLKRSTIVEASTYHLHRT
jgi:E3 ubiquitin-protein ligase DOA10